MSSKRSMFRRRMAERVFKGICLSALLTACLSLGILLTSIFSNGFSGFYATKVRLSINFDSEVLGLSSATNEKELRSANFRKLLKQSIFNEVSDIAVDAQSRREVFKLLSPLAASDLYQILKMHPGLIGNTREVYFNASSDIDQVFKGNIDDEILRKAGRFSEVQRQALNLLHAQGRVEEVFNLGLFFRGDSRYPERAGIAGALVGTFYSLLICFLLSFPVGIAAALYLEEFAPKNRLTEIIEVNINNLAAVPSIVFGLLGLGIILSVFGMPRGTPLVGGMVLAFMTLPTIIIASRAAIRAVSPSVREGAMAIGASPMQVVVHHVLPAALPGMLTGSIIGLSRALGETAPLLMIGMVAFIVDVPSTPIEPSASLPVQIYLWAESAERGFVEKTAAAIIVILTFLVVMNATAVYLRQKYERRW